MRDTPRTRGCTERIAVVVILLFVAYVLLSAIVNFFFNTFSGRCMLIAGICLFIWVDRRLRHVLSEEHIYERWDSMIPSAARMGNDLMQSVEDRLSETEAPDIQVERRNMLPGLLEGVMGQRGLFLIISNTANNRLRNHRVYIGAEEYGTKLHVFWYLARHPDFLQRLNAAIGGISILNGIAAPQHSAGPYAISKESAMRGLNVFDEQELKSFVSNAHHCLLQSIDELAKERQLDTSGIDTRSMGFLGIS